MCLCMRQGDRNECGYGGGVEKKKKDKEKEEEERRRRKKTRNFSIPEAEKEAFVRSRAPRGPERVFLVGCHKEVPLDSAGTQQRRSPGTKKAHLGHGIVPENNSERRKRG